MIQDLPSFLIAAFWLIRATVLNDLFGFTSTILDEIRQPSGRIINQTGNVNIEIMNKLTILQWVYLPPYLRFDLHQKVEKRY